MVLLPLWWSVEMCMMGWPLVARLGFLSGRVMVGAGGAVSGGMGELPLWWDVGLCGWNSGADSCKEEESSLTV